MLKLTKVLTLIIQCLVCMLVRFHVSVFLAVFSPLDVQVFKTNIRQVTKFTPGSLSLGGEARVMENLVAINNPADIFIIIGYFVMVIGVGIWVSASQ